MLQYFAEYAIIGFVKEGGKNMRKDVDGSLRVETFGDSENSFVRVSNTVLHSELNAELLKIEEGL